METWRWVRGFVLLAVLFMLSLHLRTAGLMRGLSTHSSYAYHPDEAKQVVALENFLHGRYVWYIDSPFYDGYPLALNHLDEWLMRPVLAVRAICTQHLVPGSITETVPNRLALYRWARALRVVYAMAILVLAWRLARRLFKQRWAQGLVLLLLAIAPLPIVVAHFGTGDIGVDLFTAAALLALAGYAAHPLRWRIALAGLLIGFGFACKYQGALAAAPLGLYLVAVALATRQTQRMVQNGLLALGGIVVGAVLATPAFFINASQTWKDIRTNFAFIRNYDLSVEFLALPLIEQMRFGLIANTPKVCTALGGSLILLAAAGVACAGMAWKRARSGADAEAQRRTSLWVALTCFPFLVMLLSLAGKPELQPFHFSYLQLPFSVAAVYALTVLATCGRIGRGMALLLGCLCVAELGLKTARENFFWGREDTLSYAYQLEGGLFRAGPVTKDPDDCLKRVFLEPLGPAVFRNRIRDIRSPQAHFWKELHAAPVPTVPWSLDDDWIFDNGPVFPRNDRMFKVAANNMAERQIVLYAQPETIVCGLRSGECPAEVRIDLGGAVQTLRLPPHSQRVLTLRPQHWRITRTREDDFTCDAWLVPLHVRADNGSAWVSILSDARDVALFQLFGGESDQPPVWPAHIADDALAQAIETTRYVEGDDWVDKGGNLPGLLADEVALPAGLYTLECDVLGNGAEELILAVNDHILTVTDRIPTTPLLNVRRTFSLDPGLQTLRMPFAKTFAPYTVTLLADCTNEAARITGWRLRPDAAGLIAVWRQWQTTNQRPEWLQAWPECPVTPTNAVLALDATFDGGVRLAQCGLPPTGQCAKPFFVWLPMQTERFPIREYPKLHVFVHWRMNGKHVGAADIPLWQVLVASAAGRPVPLTAPAALGPGRYEIVLGLYNIRTRLRLAVTGRPLTQREEHKRYVRIGEMELVK